MNAPPGKPGLLSLPVILPVIANQRWSCHSCGNCCRTLVGHLFDVERERIDEQGWEKDLGMVPYVRVGRSWMLNKRPDGACVFLDDNNRCKIHAKYGEAAKPLACRIFPFSVRPLARGWQVSFRFDCPSAASSMGQPLQHHRGLLQELVQQLDQAVHGTGSVQLQRGVVATVEEAEMVTARFAALIARARGSLKSRVIGAAGVSATLQQASLRSVRGPRLGELMDLLFRALPQGDAVSVEPSTRKQRGMLRQLAFAHAEHVSLAELRGGIVAGARKRWQQFRSARRFLVGRGLVPPLPGMTKETTFAAVEAVRPANNDREKVEDLLRRYVAARLQGQSVFGEGYYGWPTFAGLNALWLSVAAVGWLARHEAACHGRTELTFDDAARAVGVVDRAATRLPSLGTRGERARVAYLCEDEGVARLLHDSFPV